jgi:hypothetical protein
VRRDLGAHHTGAQHGNRANHDDQFTGCPRVPPPHAAAGRTSADTMAQILAAP